MALLLKLSLGTFHIPKAELKDLPYVLINLEKGSCMEPWLEPWSQLINLFVTHIQAGESRENEVCVSLE